MAISSLILGIIAFLVSFSIFKDLSLILAVLGLVLGIIAFAKKKSKGMSIAAIILAIISLISLFSGDTETTTTSSNAEGNSNSNKTIICNIGDTINVKDGSGNEYTLQITKIATSKERNEFSDKKPAQVFVIDYTYSCKKSNDTLFISDMNFKIVDEQGEVGETYPISVKDPQSITLGTTCKAQMAFGVYNSSKKIKLQFFDNMFDGTPTAIYEISI